MSLLSILNDEYLHVCSFLTLQAVMRVRVCKTLHASFMKHINENKDIWLSYIKTDKHMKWVVPHILHKLEYKKYFPLDYLHQIRERAPLLNLLRSFHPIQMPMTAMDLPTASHIFAMVESTTDKQFIGYGHCSTRLCTWSLEDGCWILDIDLHLSRNIIQNNHLFKIELYLWLGTGCVKLGEVEINYKEYWGERIGEYFLVILTDGCVSLRIFDTSYDEGMDEEDNRERFDKILKKCLKKSILHHEPVFDMIREIAA